MIWHLSTVGPVIPPTGVPFATPGIILVGIDLVLRGMRALIVLLDHPLQPVLVYRGYDCGMIIIA